MAETNIFCCSGERYCSSYRNDRTINFQCIQLKQGEERREIKVSGIYWIFLFTGQIVVGKGQEKKFVAAREMLLLPSSGYCLQSIEPSEMLVFTSDRPTEYCSNLVKKLPRSSLPGAELVKIAIREPLSKFLDLLLMYLKDQINCSYLYEEKQEELFMIVQSCYTEIELADFLYGLSVRRETDIKKFIEENCGQARNVQELAQLCGYSPNGFKRVFKELFDEPVYRWMSQQKALRLQARLTEEEVNLKTVINEFGFSSPAHFTKFCKQWLGMVPTKFIEEMRNKREKLEL